METPPPDFAWVAPWEPVTAFAEELSSQLHRETSKRHSLAGMKVRAIARRADNDDVLFLTDSAERPLALVHLSWSPAPTNDCDPHVVFYANWGDWELHGMDTEFA